MSSVLHQTTTDLSTGILMSDNYVVSVVMKVSLELPSLVFFVEISWVELTVCTYAKASSPSSFADEPIDDSVGSMIEV